MCYILYVHYLVAHRNLVTSVAVKIHQNWFKFFGNFFCPDGNSLTQWISDYGSVLRLSLDIKIHKYTSPQFQSFKEQKCNSAFWPFHKKLLPHSPSGNFLKKLHIIESWRFFLFLSKKKHIIGFIISEMPGLQWEILSDIFVDIGKVIIVITFNAVNLAPILNSTINTL